MGSQTEILNTSFSPTSLRNVKCISKHVSIIFPVVCSPRQYFPQVMNTVMHNGSKTRTVPLKGPKWTKKTPHQNYMVNTCMVICMPYALLLFVSCVITFYLVNHRSTQHKPSIICGRKAVLSLPAAWRCQTKCR